MLAREEWSLPKVQPADPFSLESLIAWLEKQPAETTYDWFNIDGCLMCAYLKAHGFERPAQNPGLSPGTVKDWGDDGYFIIGKTQPWTFGAALARARAVA